MIDFYHLNSSCSTAVKAILNLTDADYGITQIDPSNKSTEFLSANPLGKVPTLCAGPVTMFEGGAINLWLASCFPEAELMPPLASDAGAEALKWLFVCYSSLHPVWIRALFPANVAGQDAAPEAHSRAVQELDNIYAMIDEQLQKNDFVAGQKMTIADIYLAATIHWESALPVPITRKYPSVAALRDRVLANPAVAKAFAGEFGYAQAA